MASTSTKRDSTSKKVGAALEPRIADFRELISLLTSKESTVKNARKWVTTHLGMMEAAADTICSAVAANGTREELAFRSQLGIMYVINAVVIHQTEKAKRKGGDALGRKSEFALIMEPRLVRLVQSILAGRSMQQQLQVVHVLRAWKTKPGYFFSAETLDAIRDDGDPVKSDMSMGGAGNAGEGFWSSMAKYTAEWELNERASKGQSEVDISAEGGFDQELTAQDTAENKLKRKKAANAETEREKEVEKEKAATATVIATATPAVSAVTDRGVLEALCSATYAPSWYDNSEWLTEGAGEGEDEGGCKKIARCETGE